MNKKRQRMEIGGDNGFEEWGGYMAAKKSKLHEQFLEQAQKQDTGSKTDIFRNVAIFVNGYTVPSADELKRLMMVHGGVYHHYLSTEHTTHIIASNLPDVKIKQLKSLHINVVKPDWITACLHAGQQVDFRPFLLYSHQSTTQPSIRAFASSTFSVYSSVDVKESNELLGIKDDKSCKASTSKEHDEVLHKRTESEGGESSEDLFASPEVEDPQEDVSVHSKNEIVANSKPEATKSSNTARCATEPNFLSEFYNNSRLHHISTMGAMFKQYVSEMRQKKNDFQGLSRLKEWKRHYSNIKVKVSVCDDEEDFGRSVDAACSKSDNSGRQPFSNQVIMHIDMDCFFVSVGLRKYPHLKGKPVAVTHSKGTAPQPRNGSDRKYEFNFYRERLQGKLKSKNSSENEENMEARLAWMDNIDETDSMAEIASCSYEARQKGVKNGMFVGAALKLCPDLKVIPYDFDGYKEVAYTLYNTVASYTLDIEAVSCDEMFVDCTKLLHESQCSPLEFAAHIRQEIKEKTMCAASTGFGSNRLLARLATRKAKPDGMFYLEPSAVSDFMKTVNVADLPGVGRSMVSRLRGMGVSTCGELQKISLSKLQELGNKTGELLFDQCRGEDDRALNFSHQRKSVSAEVNYGIRFKTQQEADVFIRQLAIEVQTRLAEVKMKGRCITLKLLVRAKDAPTETAKFMGHGVCDNMTRSSTLPSAVSDADTIAGEVLQIMKKLYVDPSDMRGIGIQISRLESSNSSTGALDKFVVKHLPTPNSGKKGDTSVSSSSVEKSDVHVYSDKSPQKVRTLMKSPKGKMNIPKMSPAKKKAYAQKHTLGIDQYMVARKKTSRNDNVSKLPSPKDLDLDVLEALPEDIRKEVLEAYATNNVNQITGNSTREQNKRAGDVIEKCHQPSTATLNVNVDLSYSQVDPTFLEALPLEMRKELEEDFHQRKVLKEQQQQKHLFMTNVSEQVQPGPSRTEQLFCLRSHSVLESFLEAKEVKEMIRQWVDKEQFAQPSDVHILKHYLCDLVKGKNIDDLHLIFRSFYRYVSSKLDHSWKTTFNDILSCVQQSMLQVYHSSLHIDGFDLSL